MADFDCSNYYSSGTADHGTLIDNVNALASRVYPESNTGLLSSASSSWVSAVSKTVALAADDVAEYSVDFNYSISNGVSSTVAFQVYVGGVAVGMQLLATSPASSTDGQALSGHLGGHVENASGTVTIELKFRRHFGAGTVYTINDYLEIAVRKKRS